MAWSVHCASVQDTIPLSVRGVGGGWLNIPALLRCIAAREFNGYAPQGADLPHTPILPLHRVTAGKNHLMRKLPPSSPQG